MRWAAGKWWSFKTFKLYPCLALMGSLDEPARVLFPIGYVLYLLVMLWQVGAL